MPQNHSELEPERGLMKSIMWKVAQEEGYQGTSWRQFQILLRRRFLVVLGGFQDVWLKLELISDHILWLINLVSQQGCYRLRA